MFTLLTPVPSHVVGDLRSSLRLACHPLWQNSCALCPRMPSLLLVMIPSHTSKPSPAPLYLPSPWQQTAWVPPFIRPQAALLVRAGLCQIFACSGACVPACCWVQHQ